MIRVPDADDAACFRGNGEQPDGVLDAAVSRSTVTRDDLAHAIYARIPGLSRTDAKALLDCALEEMLSALARGEDLSLRRFGTFRIRSKNARPARNPKTGAAALVSPRRVVVFKAAPLLRAAVAATRSDQSADNAP
ncbi:integration host factor subunit alpha [Methylosinus sp. LW3]|uniref:integration host factor subunit alpha n=1 Tax=Methylosinus sp. LW3 TaxID=107635 RepID=UPI001FD875E0|nr:integration host factor subunit alpha [Methylosinus sp. LW3]